MEFGEECLLVEHQGQHTPSEASKHEAQPEFADEKEDFGRFFNQLEPHEKAMYDTQVLNELVVPSGMKDEGSVRQILRVDWEKTQMLFVVRKCKQKVHRIVHNRCPLPQCKGSELFILDASPESDCSKCYKSNPGVVSCRSGKYCEFHNICKPCYVNFYKGVEILNKNPRHQEQVEYELIVPEPNATEYEVTKKI